MVMVAGVSSLCDGLNLKVWKLGGPGWYGVLENQDIYESNHE
jgi:hypothetical protein